MKIGVIGVGSMGQNHARVLSQMDSLSAVIDSNSSVSKEVGERFEVPWFTDMSEFLATDLDAVTIATPASTHHELAMEVMENGIDPLIEKPLALTSEKGREIVDKAKKESVTLSTGMIERHNPVVSTAKTLLNDGGVGDIITLSSKRVSSFPSRVADMGVIFDLAIHDIDVMRYLVGEDMVSVFSIGGPVGSDSHEDHANILIEFESGINGMLEVNWLTPHKIRNLSITCSNDYIEMDYIDQTLVVTSSRLIEYDVSNLFDIPLENNIRRFSVKRQEPLKREMKDFIEAVKGEHPPLVNGEDGLMSMRVVEAALKSLKENKKIKL